MNTDQTMVVDLDATPFVPWGWQVHPEDQTHNVVKGRFEFAPAKIALYLSEKQRGNGRIEGNKLREELKARPVFNANLLDWLLKPENQHLIPKEWKGKAVFFWGTIYRTDGRLFVRFLRWHNGGWGWSCCWLVDDRGDVSLAAVSAS